VVISGQHCRKSVSVSSSPSDISVLFHELIWQIFRKNILRSMCCCFSRNISDFSELRHFVIYDKRFRG
jgi:hypothetical protein